MPNLNTKDNKIKETAIAILVPVLFLLYGLIRSSRGVDLQDTPYNYGNFLHLDTLDKMWYNSTFLANMLGGLFSHLPFGKTMLAMNIYCGIVKCIIPIMVYFFMTKTVGLSKWIGIVSELCALGLCWCTVSLLYNYLTYLLFTACVLLLYIGLTKDSKKFLFMAGLVLGLNVFVRLPNICEAMLILAVLYYGVIKKEERVRFFQKCGICIGGFLAAVVIMLIIAGPSGYIGSIMQMFASTKEATDYSSFGMIVSIVNGYLSSWFYFERVFVIIIPVFFIGMYLGDNKVLRYVISAVFSLVLLYWMGRNKLFTFDYTSFECVYQIAVLMLYFILITLIVVLFDATKSADDRLLSLLSVIMIVATPIGSNNGVYPILNNLFFVLPVFIREIIGYTKAKGFEFNKKHKITIKADMPLMVVLVLMAVLTIQSIICGGVYLFKDSFATAKIEGNAVLSGMHTNEENSAMLEEITDFYEGTGKESLLVYGDIPGMVYYLSAEPAISTSWPNLDSYVYDKFDSELNRLAEEGLKPVIMIDADSAIGRYLNGDLTSEEDILGPKENRLIMFIEDGGYQISYTNDRIIALLAK